MHVFSWPMMLAEIEVKIIKMKNVNLHRFNFLDQCLISSGNMESI